MFEILKSGGIVMVPIIACGLVAVFIIVERFHYFFSIKKRDEKFNSCLLYTSPSPRDSSKSRIPSSA